MSASLFWFITDPQRKAVKSANITLWPVSGSFPTYTGNYTLVGEPLFGTTDDDGYVSFATVNSGDYVLEVHKTDTYRIPFTLSASLSGTLNGNLLI